jgi:hypothetical protein
MTRLPPRSDDNIINLDENRDIEPKKDIDPLPLNTK